MVAVAVGRVVAARWVCRRNARAPVRRGPRSLVGAALSWPVIVAVHVPGPRQASVGEVDPAMVGGGRATCLGGSCRVYSWWRRQREGGLWMLRSQHKPAQGVVRAARVVEWLVEAVVVEGAPRVVVEKSSAVVSVRFRLVAVLFRGLSG